jgi:hypothetical protein
MLDKEQGKTGRAMGKGLDAFTKTVKPSKKA